MNFKTVPKITKIFQIMKKTRVVERHMCHRRIQDCRSVEGMVGGNVPSKSEALLMDGETCQKGAKIYRGVTNARIPGGSPRGSGRRYFRGCRYLFRGCRLDCRGSIGVWVLIPLFAPCICLLYIHNRKIGLFFSDLSTENGNFSF